MLKVLLLSALLALLHWHPLQLVQADDTYCFGQDTEREQTRHFTSKTAYQIVKGTNIEKQYLVPNCEPQKMWILHRHGTRYPSKKTIESFPKLEKLRDEIVKNYKVRRTQPATNALCQADLVALTFWKWNTSITGDLENFLTTQGYEDLRGTAKLYQKYYPTVLTKPFDETNYHFRHTDTQRTTESFKAFAEGIFGKDNAAEAAQTPDKDVLLRPYDYCEEWMAHDYNGLGSESTKFRRSELWNNTIADISTRLGFEYNLEVSDVLLMLDMCRYEQAWQVDRTSVWCSTFTPEQVTVFEYDDDLKYYYKSGYGYDGNSHLNCRAAQDMLTHLNSNDKPNVVAYFGHSTGVQTLLTALGVNKDDIPLTASNYNEQTERRWQTSSMDPFAANFVAVKYQCPSDAVDKEKVVFFLNQNAVDLKWCKVGLCNWSDVMQRYQSLYKADCDTYYCGRGGAAGLNVGGGTMTTLLSLLLAAVAYLMH